MILVTGPTGNIGRHVVRGLLEAGQPVRAVTRHPASAAIPDGVEIISGDLTDAGSLRVALTGVERLFLYSPADAGTGTAEVTDLARERGVRRVVLLSSQTVLHTGAGYLGQIHRNAEKDVVQSGLDWTILRPGSFATNTLNWAWSIRREGVVRASSRTRRPTQSTKQTSPPSPPRRCLATPTSVPVITSPDQRRSPNSTKCGSLVRRSAATSDSRSTPSKRPANS
jgi:uncharacterized protein YbjT (DUF2867 family)